MNANGSGRHAVAGAGAAAPRWSPDGARLVFGRSHCTPGVKGLCGAILGSVYSVGADGLGGRRPTAPIGGGPGSSSESPAQSCLRSPTSLERRLADAKAVAERHSCW